MFSKWIDESEFDGKNDFFDNSVMSVRQWLAVMSVMIIPVVNVVMIFWWAFAEKELTNSNKVNWARASVILLTASRAFFCSLRILSDYFACLSAGQKLPKGS